MGCYQSKPPSNPDLVTNRDLCLRTIDLQLQLERATSPRGMAAREEAKQSPFTYLSFLDQLVHFTGGLHAHKDLVDIANDLFKTTTLKNSEYIAVILALRVFIQEFWHNSDADFKEHFKPIIDFFDRIEKARRQDLHPGVQVYPQLQRYSIDEIPELPTPPMD